jgi:hypothetical protein
MSGFFNAINYKVIKGIFYIRRTDMLYIRKLLMVLAMGAVSFTTGAQEVYENVDKDGVVEFSDVPTPGSREIEVKPNVTEVTPVKRVAPSPAESSAKPEAADVNADSAVRQSEEVYAEDRPGRALRQENENSSGSREPRDKVSTQPANKNRVEGAGQTHRAGKR